MKIFLKLYKTVFIKPFIFLICLPLLISGCTSGSDDIIKISSSTTGQEFTKTHPSFKGENILNLGIINLRAGNVRESVKLLEEFANYHPNNPVGQFYLGKAYYKDMRYEDSIVKFKQAFILDKETPEPLLYLGRAYKKLGNRKKAVKTLYKYLLIESDTSIAEKIREEINSMSEPVIGSGIIGRIFVTNEVNREKGIALGTKVIFRANIPEIYASLEIINAPYNTEIETKWYYIISDEEKMEVNKTSFNAEGSKNALVSLKKPSSQWPLGEYKLEIYVDKEKNASVNFYIF